jgi:hypothetical protein
VPAASGWRRYLFSVARHRQELPSVSGRMFISAQDGPKPIGPALPSMHGNGAPAYGSPESGGSLGAPWFGRLSAWTAARFSHRRTPDLIDVLIAAGCFAAFSGPVLTGLAAGAGSRPAIAVFSVLAAAPLIVRRKWPIATLTALVVVFASSTLLGVQFTPFVGSLRPEHGDRDLHGRRSLRSPGIAPRVRARRTGNVGGARPGHLPASWPDQDAVQ